MWLLDKLRGSVEGCGSKKTQRSASSNQQPELQGVPVFVYANVLTPSKIPDFFIPPKLICCPPVGLEPEPDPLLLLTPEPQRRGLGPSASDQAICSRSPKGAQRSPLKSPLFSRSLVKSANRHIIQIESVDNPEDTPGTPNTNADPLSQTAMSLPYVPKAQTSYGFSTLVESPHTRRKESLFHSDPGTSPLTSPNAQRRGPTAAGGGGATLAPGDSPYRYFSGGESDTCSSAESSPFTSPLLSRSASILRSISQETQAKVFRAKRSLARHSSLSTDETCSSADNSPNVQRRRLRCSPSLSPFRSRKGGASSPGGGKGVATGGSSDLLQRAHTVNLRKGGRGTLRLSTHYDAEASRLRVRVLAAQDLYDRATDVKSINCCVALYLNPGKQQKQRSTIIKNSRHPVFNEDFFFDAVPRAALRDLALKMKVLNKGTSLKRDVMLGEREVLLSELLLD